MTRRWDSGQDGGSCGPVALPSGDGGVPAYTAPAVGQNVCTPTDISAFVTACNSGATSASACNTWATGTTGTSACGKCLFDPTGTTIAPLEVISFSASSEGFVPSIGACVLASTGTAGDSCAVAADENSYCVAYACAACSTQATFTTCDQASTGTGDVCPQTTLGTACSAYQTATQACFGSAGTSASLTAAANAICGTGPDGG